MKYLIVGLGNIGAEYAETRHNIGFMVVDALAAAAGVDFATDHYGDVAAMSIKGRRVILLKPSTYMNLSGKAVNYWLQREKIDPADMLVVVDDIALPLGVIRMRAKGSDGGHNGLTDIILTLDSDTFPRMRIGVGGDFPRGMQVDHVLGRWTADERNVLEERIPIACDAVKAFATVGLERAMNTYNKK
jgi:PTH1 family peptidyl-tRNA hydrolase